ncbi:alpha/beta fold hydrolase [Kitasatospora kifunensis]|uniref:Proline iminopeptidase n=1 Tax=Kitasatospora kifunensis TaxID=58351 RepID=A0A7W7R8X1_KITKI|nr:alpha/beta fold hydrolase [Kitasatospora kifunensis]MBB4927469.1 proline iminopeptidase [Kitasatospora kifunensis]
MDELAGVDETVLTDDDVRLWATRAGSGEPVVLCHGGPGLWDTLADLAGLLVAGATVYRWDQRGAGRSQHTGPYSVERSLADLDAVRAHFGLERMALLGHSWGAQLALEYALRHPDRVSRLVYVSGTGIDHASSWRERHGLLERELLGDRVARWEFLDKRGAARTADEDREFCVLQWSTDFTGSTGSTGSTNRGRQEALAQAERMATPWYGVNFACNAAINAETKRIVGTAELRARCEALAVPTLIVDGAADPRPRDAVDSLETALPAVSRVSLPGAGHLPWVEDPHGFRRAVGTFLASHVSRGTA